MFSGRFRAGSVCRLDVVDEFLVLFLRHRFAVSAAAFSRVHRARVRRYLHAKHNEIVSAVVRGILVQELGLGIGPRYQGRAQAPFVHALRVPCVAVAVHCALAGRVRSVPNDLLRPAQTIKTESGMNELAITMSIY